MKKNDKKIINNYHDIINGTEFSPAGSKLRYEEIDSIINFHLYRDDLSLLEYGCGPYGGWQSYYESDMREIFTDTLYHISKYVGYDINLDYVNSSKKYNFNNKNVIFTHNETDTNDVFDIVIGSGIFCYSEIDDNSRLNLLKQMYDKTQRILIVNFLSDTSPNLNNFDPEIRTTSLAEIDNMVKQLTNSPIPFDIIGSNLANNKTLVIRKNFFMGTIKQ